MSELTSERWEYLKALKPSRGRYLHISCFANMAPHPTDPLMPPLPFIEKPGTTYRHSGKPRTDSRDPRGFKGAR